jgi:hypothetical protein
MTKDICEYCDDSSDVSQLECSQTKGKKRRDEVPQTCGNSEQLMRLPGCPILQHAAVVVIYVQAGRAGQGMAELDDCPTVNGEVRRLESSTHRLVVSEEDRMLFCCPVEV